MRAHRMQHRLDAAKGRGSHLVVRVHGQTRQSIAAAFLRLGRREMRTPRMPPRLDAAKRGAVFTWLYTYPARHDTPEQSRNLFVPASP